MISRIARIAGCLRQSNTVRSNTPDLQGRTFLVTGGARGIGSETTRHLARRGAHVLVACRDRDKGENFRAAVLSEYADARITILHNADTSDLNCMRDLARRILDSDIRSIDGLILNAGIADRRYGTSMQGHELHCATNVLGHHLLTRLLLPVIGRSELKRIVGVTGEIYILAGDCTLDHRYTFGKAAAYARSKLGVLWNMMTLHELRDSLGEPGIVCVAVHPGVVATNLIRGFDMLKRGWLIAPEQGCQTPIIAATHPGIESGTYLHNTRGHVDFHAGDPALNRTRRHRFWQECEEAIASYL